MRAFALALFWLPIIAGPAWGAFINETTPSCSTCPYAQGNFVPLVPIPDPLVSVRQTALAEMPVPPGLDPGDTYQLIFATSFPTSVDTSHSVPPSIPDFGGFDAADWIVTFAAFNAGLPAPDDVPWLQGWNGEELVYKAVLSNEFVDARDRIGLEGPLYNTAGELLAADAAELFSTGVRTPIAYDERGNLITSGFDVWTGSNGFGIWNGFSCGDWDEPTSAMLGEIGAVNATVSNWITAGTRQCHLNARLYGISPVLTVAGEAVPEPTTLLLLTTALGLYSRRRRARR